jgi:hypothetical protein
MNSVDRALTVLIAVAFAMLLYAVNWWVAQ